MHVGTSKELQCGRIYKDAEIFGGAQDPGRENRLQCGRIYKDAEIARQRSIRVPIRFASMWPHL